MWDEVEEAEVCRIGGLTRDAQEMDLVWIASGGPTQYVE